MNKSLIVLSLFLMPIFGCQDNNVIKPDKSVVPTQSSSMMSATPSIPVNPTILPSVSTIPSPPVPSPVVSMPPKMVDQAKIDYPDDYNQEAIPDVIYSNAPVPNITTPIISEAGKVYDRNNQPVADANIIISSFIPRNKEESERYYFFSTKTKTDINGAYKFKAYELLSLNVLASKPGFTTRKITVKPDHNNDGGASGTLYYYDFGGKNNLTDESEYFSINNEPEITDIKINSQQVRKYSSDRVLSLSTTQEIFNVYKNGKSIIINSKTDFSRFKIKSTSELEIEIKFNKNVNKSSVEDSFEIKSLYDIDIYDKNTKDISFNWFENDSKLNLNIPIKTYNIDKKYRLGFKDQFTDLEGNKAYSGMYISLTSLSSGLNQLSENIVFSIAGNK